MARKRSALPARGRYRRGGAERRFQIEKGQQAGNWTLMAVVRDPTKHPLAVFEDFTQPNGTLLFADEEG